MLRPGSLLLVLCALVLLLTVHVRPGASSRLLQFPHGGSPLPETGAPQHTGFLLANPATGADMFYWLFESTDNATRREEIPLVLWLEGGPGIAGLFQVFYGMGPYRIDLAENVELNPSTWMRHFHLLFVDNPCGVGYSTVRDGQGYVTDMEEMAAELYTALLLFFQEHPSLASTDFYIFGESYGGKYGPAIAEYIHRMNQGNPKIKINLKGLGLGNGLVDTPTQVTAYADFYLNTGLYTEKQQERAVEQQAEFARLYAAEDYYGATGKFWDIVYAASFISGFNFYDYSCNYDCMQARYDWTAYERFLNREEVKELLGTTNRTFVSVSPQVSGALYPDVCKSMAHVLPTLLDHYKVLLYQGPYDTVVTAVGTERWVNRLPWGGIEEFKQARRSWWVDESATSVFNVAGLVRKHDTLTHIQFQNAGHFVNMDQPARTLDMVTRFIRDLQWEPDLPIPTPPARPARGGVAADFVNPVSPLFLLRH